MKKLLLLGILSAACVAEMSAQTLTVSLKDGTTHKFDTRAISEIVVEEDAKSKEITFAKVQCDPYSSGNVTLKFTDAEGSTLELDTYGPADIRFFQPGVYEVGASSGLSIDASSLMYTNFTPAGGQAVALKAGKMTVAKDGVNYKFDMAFTLGDDTELKAEYAGPVAGYDGVYVFEASAAKYIVKNNAKPGEISVKMNDSNWKLEARVDFMTSATDGILPAGTYVFDNSDAAGTLNSESNIYLYSPFNGAVALAKGSVATVTKNGDDYNIDVVIKGTDGVEVKITYSGKIGAAN